MRWHLCSREHASTTGHMLYKLAIFASALLAGATVVLPGASGIRGCGSPKQRAEVSDGA